MEDVMSSTLRKQRPSEAVKPPVLAKMSEERFSAGMLALAVIAIRIGRAEANANPGIGKVQ